MTGFGATATVISCGNPRQMRSFVRSIDMDRCESTATIRFHACENRADAAPDNRFGAVCFGGKIRGEDSFAPMGLALALPRPPRLAPWAAFFRRFAASVTERGSGVRIQRQDQASCARRTAPSASLRAGGGGCLHMAILTARISPQATSIFSSTRCLSFSSEPVSSKAFVVAALPFSTLVMT